MIEEAILILHLALWQQLMGFVRKVYYDGKESIEMCRKRVDYLQIVLGKLVNLLDTIHVFTHFFEDVLE